jgi:hypothetical protein
MNEPPTALVGLIGIRGESCRTLLQQQLGLVFEVSHSGEDHRQIVFVRSRYYLFVTH